MTKKLTENHKFFIDYSLFVDIIVYRNILI